MRLPVWPADRDGGSSVALWVACLWGLAGSALVEALDLYQAIQRVKDFPWRLEGEVFLLPYVVSVVIRLGLGTGVAAAFGASAQIAGPLGALAVGVAAPKIVQQFRRDGQHIADAAVAPGAAPASGAAEMQGATDAA